MPPTLLHRLTPGLFVLLWSSGFIGAKFGLPHADAFSFLLTRFIIAASLMAVVAWIGGARWPRGRMILHVAVVGLLVHATYLGGVFFAIGKGLGAAVAALIVGLQPIMTAVVAAPLLGERVGPIRLLGLLCALAGVGLVLWDPRLGLALGGDLPVAGLIAAGIALMGITIGTIYQKRFCTGVDSRPAASLQYAVSMLPMLVLIGTQGYSRIDWTPGFLLALGWLVLALSVGAVLLLFLLLRRGEAVGVANLFNLSPPTTALLAWLLFDEPLSLLDLSGFALTAFGVWLAARKPAAPPSR